MKDENRQIFEENLRHYHTLVNAGYMVHLSGRDRSSLVKAMSEEFQPGYSSDLWCPPCVANMMHQVYRRYLQFVDEERKQEEVRRFQSAAEAQPPTNFTPEEIAKMLEPRDMPVPEPVEEPKLPIQTKANFPSHKHQPRRR